LVEDSRLQAISTKTKTGIQIVIDYTKVIAKLIVSSISISSKYCHTFQFIFIIYFWVSITVKQ